MRTLQTALRLAYRLRWEIIEPYKHKQGLGLTDIRAIQNILERLEREAHFHGLFDRGILCNQFGSDAPAVHALYDEWDKIRNTEGTGLLDQAFCEGDGRKAKQALQALICINKEFMILASKRFSEVVLQQW